LTSLARISYFETPILVVLLDGTDLDQGLQSDRLVANACLEFIRADPNVTAIAICEQANDWATLVLDARIYRLPRSFLASLKLRRPLRKPASNNGRPGEISG
jgi:hypothetical protein